MSPHKRSPPKFQNPNNFTRVHRSSNQWACQLCSGLGQMNLHQALKHESSPEHAKNAAMNEPNWWGPLECNWDEGWAQPIGDDPPLSKEAMKDREHRYFADQVDDLVPFWIQSVKAAEHGEILKLSDFLESLEDRNIWPPRVPNPWRNPEAQSVIGGKCGSKNDCAADWDMAPGWKSHSGGQSDVSWGSDERNGFSLKNDTSRHERRKIESRLKPRERMGHDFVEDIAIQEAADDARKLKMHAFFELPTTEKVKRIDELIRSLHLSQFSD